MKILIENSTLTKKYLKKLYKRVLKFALAEDFYTGGLVVGKVYVGKLCVEGVRCNRCGTTVLKSEVEGYTYQCMHCNEDLSTFETYKSDDTYSADEFDNICNYTLAELLLDEEK